MLCLNIRSTYPRIGLRTQLSSIETKSPSAQMHTKYEAPIADIWPSSVEVDINQYPSRKAYGFRTARDFCAEAAQKGFSGVKAGIDRRVQEGDEMLENGAKRNVIAAQEKSKLVPKQRILVVNSVPKPEINVKPSQMQGNIDQGNTTVTIDPQPVEVNYTPGSVDIYMENKGSIRMWMTEGRYDIYA